MVFKIFLFVFATYNLATISVIAQPTAGMTGIVVYDHQLARAIGEFGNNGTASLYFNQTKSVYIHENAPKKDSIIENGTMISVLLGDAAGFPVFKDLQQQKSVVKMPMALGSDRYIVEDSLPAIAWVISSEQKELSGFKCQKATGAFGGRVYDVWFTEDVPVSTGPHRLWGLPGLILDARSRDNMVSFRFVSLRFTKEASRKIEPPKAKITFNSLTAFLTAERELQKRREKEAKAEFPNGVINIPPLPPDYRIEKY